MDRIVLKGLRFEGHIGATAAERKRRQPLEVDLELEVDLTLPGETDQLQDTVDYSQVFEVVRGLVEEGSHRLLERLAEIISREIRTRFPVGTVRVVVRKPAAPVGGTLAWAAADITRSGPLAPMTAGRTVETFLGLGANVGDRRRALSAALASLRRHPRLSVTSVSSLYETEPVGGLQQDWFLNAVAVVETDLSPRALLRALKMIEWQLGRRPGPRWGPRVVDVDLLLYGGVRIRRPDLVVPHPELTQRAFVLVPLAELVPGLVLPDGRPVRDYLPLVRNQVVRRVAAWPWEESPAPLEDDDERGKGFPG